MKGIVPMPPSGYVWAQAFEAPAAGRFGSPECGASRGPTSLWSFEVRLRSRHPSTGERGLP